MSEPKETCAQTVGGEVTNLLETHWPQIDRLVSNSEECKASISFTIKLEQSGKGVQTKTSIRYAEVHTDSTERLIDPNQIKMEGIE